MTQELHDWSAQFVPTAGREHLDPDALALARQDYERYTGTAARDDMEFLEQLGVASSGVLTRAALLLFGTAEASMLLPHPGELSWRLLASNEAGHEKMYPPLFSAMREVCKRLRRHAPEAVAIALDNALAHQDYTKQARIMVTEYDRYVVIENIGTFKSAPAVWLRGEGTSTQALNPCLEKALRKLRPPHSTGGLAALSALMRERKLPQPEFDLEGGFVRVLLRVSPDAPPVPRLRAMPLRLRKQKGSSTFGGAFWLLANPCLAAEFMEHPGYKAIRETTSDGRNGKIRKMKEHLKMWELHLLINGEAWDGKTMWTDFDTLYCPDLKEAFM